MIHVHHLEKSRSHRVIWLLELLGLEYDIHVYKRNDKTMQAPKALKEVHPLGKSPVIVDGELTIAESGAIIDYLVERYGKGRFKPDPEDVETWLDYRYWLHYAEGSLMPLLLMSLVFSHIPKQSPALVRPVAKGISSTIRERFLDPQLDQHMAFIEAHLRAKENFGGAWPSGADVQMSFPMLALKGTRSLGNYPAIAGFTQRLESDPAWQRVIERAGPLDILER
ncbi:glutathione S-transferase [Halomonas sp. PAMB 3264]|uniref:glutathione S-transferase family protein n=1 Tax=unclassified Halomonas TaxID=2609666 RepID=UPI00289CBF8F|nr:MULTISPECIES: glutathione S-transferase [unclassified Halomonas]WNL38669.1 glutathione S-transferase [Halomonas sp. PAMB 3232]WNL42009.1 glutathione S-transferase [Halomonas sp. PAMB 3264]